MTILTSTRWPHGTANNRKEADVRAVRARRALLEADLMAEGSSPATVARLATPAVAAGMLAHEGRVIDLVEFMFGDIGAGLK